MDTRYKSSLKTDPSLLATVASSLVYEMARQTNAKHSMRDTLPRAYGAMTSSTNTLARNLFSGTNTMTSMTPSTSCNMSRVSFQAAMFGNSSLKSYDNGGSITVSSSTFSNPGVVCTAKSDQENPVVVTSPPVVEGGKTDKNDFGENNTTASKAGVLHGVNENSTSLARRMGNISTACFEFNVFGGTAGKSSVFTSTTSFVPRVFGGSPSNHSSIDGNYHNETPSTSSVELVVSTHVDSATGSHITTSVTAMETIVTSVIPINISVGNVSAVAKADELLSGGSAASLESKEKDGSTTSSIVDDSMVDESMVAKLSEKHTERESQVENMQSIELLDTSTTVGGPSQQKKRDLTKIIVAQIPASCMDKDIIKKHFQRFGQVKTVLLYPRSNQAIVKYKEQRGASKAKRKGKKIHRNLPEVKIRYGTFSRRKGKDSTSDAMSKRKAITTLQPTHSGSGGKTQSDVDQ